MRRNITALYLIKMSKWFTLVMPIIVLFFQDNGLNITDIMLLKGIYSVVVVCLEVPSGYCADAWGRKNSLILGTVMATLGFAIYASSFVFWGFLLGEIALAIGHSLVSGADSAMLYDTLLNMKREKEYTKEEGRVTAMGSFGEAIASILGGILAGYSLRIPFICQTFIAFVGVPAAIMLSEPQQHLNKVRATFRDTINIIKSVIIEDRRLRWNIIYSSVIGCATLTMAWFAQPLFQAIEIEVTLYGVIWTALNVTVAVVSAYAYKIEQRLGKLNTSIAIAVGIGGCYIISGLFMNWISIVTLFLFYMVRGVSTPVLKEYINRITSSDIRATVLSLRNLLIRLLFSIVAPAMGYITDNISLQFALISFGIIILILSTITIVGLNRVERLC